MRVLPLSLVLVVLAVSNAHAQSLKEVWPALNGNDHKKMTETATGYTWPNGTHFSVLDEKACIVELVMPDAKIAPITGDWTPREEGTVLPEAAKRTVYYLNRVIRSEIALEDNGPIRRAGWTLKSNRNDPVVCFYPYQGEMKCQDTVWISRWNPPGLPDSAARTALTENALQLIYSGGLCAGASRR